jgi:TonB dependent receptor/TonB-dependent Receptor Plug Domain
LASCALGAVLLCHPAAAQLRGRPVSTVLDELRAQGLTFIYNTRLVPPDLYVEQEPRARKGIALAREVLAAHGLQVSQVAPGVYAISRGRAPALESTAATPAESPLEEVVVQTSRYTLGQQQVLASAMLTQQQIKDLPRLADETLRAIERLPGSASNGFSSLGPIRGGQPDETAIFLDGLRLYEPFHLKNFLNPVSLLDSRVIDHMEFYSGAFPARYGTRMSSVVDATSVHPASPRYVELGLSLFHASALGSLRLDEGRGAVLLAARRSNLGDLVQFSERKFGEPHYSDGRARFGYQLSDRTHASFDVLVSNDSITAISGGGEERASAQYRNVYTWATLDHEWSPQASSRLIASYTDLSNERRATVDAPGQRFGVVEDDRLFHVIGVQLDNTFDPGAGLQHRFGVEVRRPWGSYDYFSDVVFEQNYPFPGSPPTEQVRRETPRPHGYETSAYWDSRIDLSRRWAMQLGLRVDTQTYDGSNDGEQWGPRLSALYQAGPRTQLRASWGQFYQSQGINELQVEDGVARFFPAQHANQAVLSVEHFFAAGVDLRLEAYRKDYRRLRPRFENLFDPLLLFPEAAFDRVMIAPDGARAEGVELLLQLRPHGTRLGSWSGWLAYAWARAEDHIDGSRAPRNWDQRNALNLGLMWSRGPWTVTLTDTYHSGWPTTRLQVATPAGAVPQIVLDQRNRARLADYNSLDLKATYTFALAYGALDVFVEATNVLSRANPCCSSYTVTGNPDGTPNIVRDADSWLPLVPSIGVLWRY